ncbi:hypothetical protein [Mesorhizobium sp.]|uniref:hypothetical protein n=1 Tax=Mesorhizobium sp. TaxID=1871066 RepID=UPI000FE7B920|nr:hypothetical protein [Mesorhizobium sp.]RWO20655.1 MAG: hypothetical protein EOS09_26410 [Mesorhizobium sp.]
MVATVGSISIDLSTNAAKFATGFKSAATTVDRESARMSKAVAGFGAASRAATGVLSGFVGGIVAGGALAALTSLGGALDKARSALSDFEAVANEARVVGLKTDMFQAISFGALEADVSQEKLNAGLEIFAKNVGLAQIGTGALYSKLKELNPELLRAVLNTNDQGERLKLVADAMRDTTDATQKAALATAVFGKGGIEMIRVLDGGRQALDDFKRRAADLGLIIPDDLLQRAGELDDKLEVLSKVVDVNLNQALVNLAPLIVDATGGMAGFAQELKGFSEQVKNFTSNPSLENLLKLISGDIDGGGSIERAVNGIKNLASEFGRSTADIEADIAKVKALLADLKVQAEAGFIVDLETDRAVEDLKFLQEELRRTQAVGVTAANEIRAGFAQAFREAENASMKALDAYRASDPKPLPTVKRYGGDPDEIELPSTRFNRQQDVNGSGVTVTKFGGTSGKPIAYIPPGMAEDDMDDNRGVEYQRKAADNTEETSDNVSTLDRNTKSYLSSLSSDIGGYSAQTNVVINRLSDVTAATAKYLSQSMIAALALKNDSSSPGSGGGGGMFGDAISPNGSSYISSWGRRIIKKASYQLSPTSDDGSFDTSVNVQQPGTNITLNYQAAPGESERTARQRAREMYDELLMQSARA